MSERPNILVLMSDQHSRHVLGCHGNGIVRTPNLDRLAREGVRFTDAYCPSPLCVPSRTSFLTSRTPTRNRVWTNGHFLSSGIPTWAHALGAAGYETALIGRMHFVGPDQRHGFEKRPLGEYDARPPGTPMPGGPPWTKYSSKSVSQERPCVEIAGTGTTIYQHFDDRVAETTRAYLREKAADNGRPFAAVAGSFLPHCPFIAPRELFEYYYDRVDVPEVESDQPESTRLVRRVHGILDPFDPERVRLARAAYFALCEYLDRRIGAILDTLEETGLARNTLVVYTSDHGEMAGEHGLWWKSCYYEGSAGVPLIARLPGVIRPGWTSNAICTLMDLGPTFAEIAGTRMERVDGRSLLPALCAERTAAEDRRLKTEGATGEETAADAASAVPSAFSLQPSTCFSEVVDFRGGPPNLPSRMIRSGPWKLWYFHNPDPAPPALFNLDEDPDELNDLSSDPKYAGVRDELLARIFDGWDPDTVRDASDEQEKDHRPIAAWGRAVNPACEDALPAPPAKIESDVELK